MKDTVIAFYSVQECMALEPSTGPRKPAGETA